MLEERPPNRQQVDKRYSVKTFEQLISESKAACKLWKILTLVSRQDLEDGESEMSAIKESQNIGLCIKMYQMHLKYLLLDAWSLPKIWVRNHVQDTAHKGLFETH